MSFLDDLFGIIDEVSEKVNEKKYRKSRAEEHRRAAQEYVRDGEELYERAYSDLSTYSYDTKHKVEEYAEYKGQFIKELNSDILPVLSDFASLDINSKVFDAPVIDSHKSGLDLFEGLPCASCFQPPFSISIKDIISFFDDGEEEYNEALRQRNEARDFFEKMIREREKLRNMKRKMEAIQRTVDDDMKILEVLRQNLRVVFNPLKDSLKRSSLTQSEADDLKRLHKIAESVSKRVSTRFLNNDFTIRTEYQDAFQKIKEINDALPSTPMLSDNSNTLKNLLEILEESIIVR